MSDRLIIGCIGLFVCFILFWIFRHMENTHKISREQWLSTFVFIISIHIFVFIIPINSYDFNI